MKKKSPEYWDALTKDKAYKKHIKTDFAKFCEEDDPEYAGNIAIVGDEMGMNSSGGIMPGMEGMDMEKMMAQMSGMGGGMGGFHVDEEEASLSDVEPGSLPPPLEGDGDPPPIGSEEMEEVD